MNTGGPNTSERSSPILTLDVTSRAVLFDTPAPSVGLATGEGYLVPNVHLALHGIRTGGLVTLRPEEVHHMHGRICIIACGGRFHLRDGKELGYTTRPSELSRILDKRETLVRFIGTYTSHVL